MTASQAADTEGDDCVLQPGRNCWRIERAERAALLVDGERYFSAVHEALLNARHSIFIIGWDVDSRLDLLPGRRRKAGDPPHRLGALLSHIARARPQLTIHILLWDYSMLFALERELLPALQLGWTMPAQVKLCLDDVLPLAASHHQKIVVVDDAVAFCGGLDLTIRRWDTSEHRIDNPDRVDPDGERYPPFHDMQMVVDGDAAKALAELARDRWERACGRPAAAVDPRGDPWPEAVQPDFRDSRIAIARTLPEVVGEPGVQEVETLYLDSIGKAERFIYAENQYLTADSVTDALIARMRERPDLEAVFVCPEAPGGWLESRSMGIGRARLAQRLEEAGVMDRIRIVHPVVSDGERNVSVMVHAKFMVIDDRMLRIGSSNLNNRSMGFDSECDLAIEATSEEESAIIAGLRRRQLSEHLGIAADRIEAEEEQAGSLRALIDNAPDGAHTLRPVRNEQFETDDLTRAIMSLADPREPLPGTDFAGDPNSENGGSTGLPRKRTIAALLLVLGGLFAAWHFTPVADWLDPERVGGFLDQWAGNPWSAVLLPLTYVLGGLVAFPITLLIAGTALAFGPLSGFLLAATGSLLSAAVTYAIGAWLGRRTLRKRMGQRLNKISRALGEKGIIAVVTLRTAPIAPFTVVNLVCGTSHVGFLDYMLGTAIGMAPGIIAMTAMGSSLREVLLNPQGDGWLFIGGAVLLWLVLGLGAQVAVSWLRRRKRESQTDA